MVDVSTAYLLQNALHAACQVLASPGCRQGLLQCSHGGPVKDAALVDCPLPLVGDEPSEQFGVDRLAVRGQARDLSFVLLRLESAHVRDISVVIADRIEAAYVVQASKATVLDMVDVRGGIVPGAVYRDH